MIKVLNLYAGLGGNRKLWRGVQVTAVENDPRIAAVYQRLYPRDLVIVEDAHAYLEKNYKKYDFVWTSPPCGTHSSMNNGLKFKRYPDLKLYEEILLLKQFFKGKWVVENVRPYYKPLIEPNCKLDHNVFWSNFNIPLKQFDKFIGSAGAKLREKEYAYQKFKWLGIDVHLDELAGVKSKRQIADNCVTPAIGEYILKHAKL